MRALVPRFRCLNAERSAHHSGVARQPALPQGPTVLPRVFGGVARPRCIEGVLTDKTAGKPAVASAPFG